MDHVNPYVAPRKTSESLHQHGASLSPTKALGIVVVSALGFGAGGAAIGYALAIFAPGYYRGVFSAAREPGFDAVQVGIGLGLTEGGICGIFVGIAVLLAVAWSRGRTRDRGDMIDSSSNAA